jgi:hypothetical protein
MMIMLTPLNWKAGGVRDAEGAEFNFEEIPPELPPDRGGDGSAPLVIIGEREGMMTPEGMPTEGS